MKRRHSTQRTRIYLNEKQLPNVFFLFVYQALQVLLLTK